MVKSWASNTQHVDIELTTICNVGCIACARINNNHMDRNFQDWKTFITRDLSQIDLKRVTFTSFWGDPLSNPDFLPFLDLLAQRHPSIVVEIKTSLNYGDESFYKELATVCNKFTRARVLTYVYGVDDLHTRFRKNANFDNLKLATKTLSQLGVSVFWKMPLFKYNQDNFQELTSVAEECGVYKIESVQYHNDSIFGSGIVALGDEAVQASLEPPVNPSFDDEDFGNQPWQPTQKNSDFEDDCPSLEDKSIWIDPWGGVWPCYALGKYSMDVENPDGLIIDRSIEQFGYFNNLNNNSLMNILQHKWFVDVLPTAQAVKPWRTCQQECDICGTEV